LLENGLRYPNPFDEVKKVFCVPILPVIFSGSELLNCEKSCPCNEFVAKASANSKSKIDFFMVFSYLSG